MTSHRAATIGIAGLALIAFTYWFTYEPAPSIRLRWRDDVTAARQAQLERRYLLVDPRAPAEDAPRSLAYDLLNTSRLNIEALVSDQEAADTNDIDRDNFEVYPYTDYGDNWIWLAHRLPVVRYASVRWALIIGLAASVLFGLRRTSGGTT